ncbi:bifunctional tetrahydrofolate synthase/dihydrofolate synthase [Acidihalobacter prosperus]|uniref:Dihydrofolate synthase/folylpolyglutamate synthase n=1 Tax=Acidihalobacter prosperus TaxID=160660 RepID=A0A1A6C2W8_9GAMM|nr:bifunctional tetrahydrofolate synthase/dihydrofolate synthase [Acidihalobacter prosperus]OBS08912.1 hypothetical protein Thpro_023162 [Acidihalobacter prosperus]
MRFASLDEWLAWQETLSPRAIDLGLDRVRAVGERMRVVRPTCPVITVAGTNGKGSTVAMLSAMLRAAGYRVGAYTSPHLLRYNERVCVDDEPVSDAFLCAAFDAIDAARGDTRLTYFEYGTLAALWCFAQANVEVMLLEVGLGGRLDAVNIVDADVAVVTTIDLDHTDWLGDTRELIAIEKAGIQRAGRPLVCGDRAPPASLLRVAVDVGSELLCIGRDFDVEWVDGGLCWQWHGETEHLPAPALPGRFQADNAACACMALACLRARLPTTQQARADGLRHIRLGARFEPLAGAACEVVCDVAHNPQAARALSAQLADRPVTGRNLAVFSALADKDVPSIVAAMDQRIDVWYVAGLEAPRGLTAQALVERMGTVSGKVATHPEIVDAYAAACRDATAGDRIVVFGSFLTVAAVRQGRV